MDRDLYIDEQAELLSQIGNAHLFIIGIDAYKNGISPLNNCVRDAEKLKKILTEKYHFPLENVKELYNENATLENIITQLDEYSAKLGEKDSLLISFSGHGFYKNEIGYLVPADAKNGKVFGFLNNEQLKSYLKSCKAKHILLVVDSCYSGSFLLKDKDGNEQKSLANEVAKYKSRWVLAAGRIEKVADGEYGKHSPFATTLHTYLEKNTDKVFCISDLAQYVKNITPHNSNQFPIAGILRDANDEGGEFVFFPRNNEKEDFDACKTKAEFVHFLQKYKEASPARVAHANAQIKAFEEKEEAQKAASQREKARELYEKMLKVTWEEKYNLVREYKKRFPKEVDKDLYDKVLSIGEKADDYPEWKKVNKSSENAIERFIDKHEYSFFVAEAKDLLQKLQSAQDADKIESEKAKKVEEAEAKRQAAEKLRLEKEQKETAEKQFVAAANLGEREEKKREESEKVWAARKAFLSKYKYAFMLVPVIIGILWLGNEYNREQETQKHIQDSLNIVEKVQAEEKAQAEANKLAKHLQDSLRKDSIVNLFPMVEVEGGTFQMGSNGGDSDEKPAHSVMLSDFSIGKTEVTQKQWRAVMVNNPSHFPCEDCPVENISWDDVQLFIQKLNELTGKKYSLPSEAQWEFAARGGTKSKGYKYAGSNDLGEIACYGDNSGDETHKVSTKKANELGLYDMSGNVWEWCADDWHENYNGAPKNGIAWNDEQQNNTKTNVLRGGSWNDFSTSCRVAYRSNGIPSFHSYVIGFRVIASGL